MWYNLLLLSFGLVGKIAFGSTCKNCSLWIRTFLLVFVTTVAEIWICFGYVCKYTFHNTQISYLQVRRYSKKIQCIEKLPTPKLISWRVACFDLLSVFEITSFKNTITFRITVWYNFLLFFSALSSLNRLLNNP